MRIKVDPDGEKGVAEDSERQISAHPATPSDASNSGFQVQNAGKRNLEFLLAGAMAGTLPLDRPLDTGEPQKLNPVHINMVLDRANGLKGAEIAEKYDMHPVYVNKLLRHPYSVAILNQMFGMVADKMTEPAERLKAYAHEMIDTKITILRTTDNEKLKNHIASDILDRAGFGARTKLDGEVVHRFALPAAQASQIAAALQEADRVEEVDYDRYVESNITEGLSQGSGVSNRLPAGTEHSMQVATPPGGASPVDGLEQCEVAA